MANLGTWDIVDDDYVNVETATGQTFTASTKYIIQSLDNDFYFRLGSTGDGNYVKTKVFVDYTAGTDDVFVKPVSAPVRLNIVELE